MMNLESRKAEIKEKLNLIKNLSPVEIAEFFKKEGVSGIPQSCGRCPIAIYLNNGLEPGRIGSVMVTDVIEMWNVDNGWDGGLHREVIDNLSFTLFAFIRGVDEGLFV